MTVKITLKQWEESCPEGPGVTPDCPNGEPCICIDVDGSVTTEMTTGDTQKTTTMQMKSSITMTTVLMKATIMSAGWTSGTTIMTVTTKRVTAMIADCSQESSNSWMCFAG